MSRTAAFGDELDRRGVWYPRGDGDGLRSAAQCWTELADFIEELIPVLDAAADRVTENYRGEAASRFGEAWARWTVDPNYLHQTVADCRRLAATLTDFGGDIDAADSTLLHLLEEALDFERRAIAEAADPAAYNEWLRECADGLAGELGTRADQRCHGLGDISQMHQAGEPADLSKIDPAAIAWPDPGNPADLSVVGDTVVDFGAGQGELPEFALDPAADAVGAGAGDAGAGGAGAGGGGAGGGGAGGGGLGDLGDLGGGGGGMPAGGGGGLGDLGDLGGEETGAKISVPLPGGGAGLKVAGGLAAAAVGGAAASGRMPMMPMMPMGAGGGGDESQEPRRRSNRRRMPVAADPAPAPDPGERRVEF